MNFEFTDGCQTWHVYVDDAGQLHDEPVQPAEQQPQVQEPPEDPA